MPDTTVLATFNTIEKASPEVLNELIGLKKLSNIFLGFETKDLDFKNESLAVSAFKLGDKAMVKKVKNSI